MLMSPKPEAPTFAGKVKAGLRQLAKRMLARLSA